MPCCLLALNEYKNDYVNARIGNASFQNASLGMGAWRTVPPEAVDVKVAGCIQQARLIVI